MAKEKGFLVEVTAFLPAGTTDVQDMGKAAETLAHLTEHLHIMGFSAVAVSSKFTSRKVDEVVPTPMQDLDDSKFPTNSGTPIGADASAALDIPPELDRRVKQA